MNEFDCVNRLKYIQFKRNRPEKVLTCHGIGLLVGPQSICCLTRVLSLFFIFNRNAGLSSKTFLNLSIWYSPDDVRSRVSFTSTEKCPFIKIAGDQDHCWNNCRETYGQNINSSQSLVQKKQNKHRSNIMETYTER